MPHSSPPLAHPATSQWWLPISPPQENWSPQRWASWMWWCHTLPSSEVHPDPGWHTCRSAWWWLESPPLSPIPVPNSKMRRATKNQMRRNVRRRNDATVWVTFEGMRSRSSEDPQLKLGELEAKGSDEDELEDIRVLSLSLSLCLWTNEYGWMIGRMILTLWMTIDCSFSMWQLKKCGSFSLSLSLSFFVDEWIWMDGWFFIFRWQYIAHFQCDN